jgi:hypothetical protein
VVLDRRDGGRRDRDARYALKSENRPQINADKRGCTSRKSMAWKWGSTSPWARSLIDQDLSAFICGRFAFCPNLTYLYLRRE